MSNFASVGFCGTLHTREALPRRLRLTEQRHTPSLGGAVQTIEDMGLYLCLGRYDGYEVIFHPYLIERTA